MLLQHIWGIFAENLEYILRKLITISLLMVYLYDLGGYMGIRRLLVYHADHILRAQAAKGEFNQDDLVEIQVPLADNDAPVWNDYQNIKGQIQFENVAYNYLQVKVSGNTLYLRCIPHYYTTKLINQNIIWANPIKNTPAPHKDPVPQAGIIFMNGFTGSTPYAVLSIPVVHLKRPSFTYLLTIIDRHIDIPKQPPKQVC